MSYFKDVGAFHRKFELPHHLDSKPHLLSPEFLRIRIQHLTEELNEFIEAANRGDLVEQVDALCDLIYVAAGTAHFMGVDLDPHWAEVQRANMTKVRGVGKRGHGFDVIKPEGFVGPDHRPILRRDGWVG